MNFEMNSAGAFLSAIRTDRKNKTPIDQVVTELPVVTSEHKDGCWTVEVEFSFAFIEQLFGKCTFGNGYTFKGNNVSASNLFATNHQQTAESSNFITTDPDYSIVEVNMAETDMLEGLRDGLVGVRAGEECEILFTAKYGYGNKTFGIIPVNSALLYKIWVAGVAND